MTNRTGYTKIFRDPQILEQMLAEFKSGQYSMSALGRKYGVDHTSIYYQISKAGIRMPKRGSNFYYRIASVVPPIKRRRTVIGMKSIVEMKYPEEDVRPGKSYLDYIKEEEKKTGKKIRLPKSPDILYMFGRRGRWKE